MRRGISHWLGLACVVAVLSGCASFNDTVVVDVGEQFGLLTIEAADGGTRRHWRPGQGFECDFTAQGRRGALFGGETQVTGKLRCVAVGDMSPAVDDAGKEAR